MTKEIFVEYLKKKGYGSAVLKDGRVEVTIVGDAADYRKAKMDIMLFAKKVGYTHSFGVKLLQEEENDI